MEIVLGEIYLMDLLTAYFFGSVACFDRLEMQKYEKLYGIEK